MFLTIRICALAVLDHFVEIAPQRFGQLVHLGPFASSSCSSSRVSCISSISSTETAEKLLTKLSWFLISCAIPAVSWPSEALTARLCVGANPYIGSRGVFDDRQALAGRPGRDLST
jgi:hypothetical protein